MFIALIFVGKKIFDMGIEPAQFLDVQFLLPVIFLSVLYALIFAFSSYTWHWIIKVVVDKKFSFLLISKIYCKSNVMKYIPGNVFQFVARNELAIIGKTSHADIAFSTLLQVLLQSVTYLFLSLFLSWSSISKVIYAYRSYWKVAVLFIFLAAGIVFGCIFCNKKILIKFKKYKRIFYRNNVYAIIKCFVVNLLFSIFTAMLYIYILYGMQHIDIAFNFENLVFIIGIFSLSWLVGFIVPGAPGGIGIREAVLTLLVSGFYDAEPFVMGIIIYRIINIFGDVIAMCLTGWLERKTRRL